MPLTQSLGYCILLAGSTWSDALGRTLEGQAMGYGLNIGGVYQDINRFAVTATSGMNLSIDAGAAVIPSSSGVTNGCYRVNSATAQTVTVAAADPSNPRIDLVVCAVTDNGNSSSFSWVGMVTGTPASSPSPPPAPSNSITLAQVRVNAGVTSITSSNITDERAFQCAPGGILPLPSTTSPPTGQDGQYAYDKANDRVFHLAATGPRQLRTLPWAPVFATRNTNFSITTSVQTVLSVNITTDGATDIDIAGHWVGIYQATPVTSQVQMLIFLDSTQLDEQDLMTSPDDIANSSHLGGTLWYTTSSAAGDTPTAGTHTIYLKTVCDANGSGTGMAIRATTTRNTYLRVKPVNL